MTVAVVAAERMTVRTTPSKTMASLTSLPAGAGVPMMRRAMTAAAVAVARMTARPTADPDYFVPD